jgi:hypothetical protein
MFVSRQEKERLVLDLYYNQGKTFRDIAKEVRMSFTDISFIIKKKEAEEEEENNNINKDKNHQQQLSPFTKAYKLYSKGKSPVQVAIDLNIQESQATQFYKEYWRLRGFHELNSIYEKTNGKIWIIVELYKNLIENRGMSIDQIVNAVDTAANKLPYIESLYEQAKEEVDNLRDRKLYLLKDVDFLSAKISRLKETVYSLEQNCGRRKEEQGIQDFDNAKEMMIKILSAMIINHVQSLLNGTLSSSVPDSSSSSNPILSSESSPTFSNQTDHQNDRYNIKQRLSEEIHEIHKGDISDG